MELQVWQYIMVHVLILGIAIFNFLISMELANYVVKKIKSKKEKK